jgi:hypothetical protein
MKIEAINVADWNPLILGRLQMSLKKKGNWVLQKHKTKSYAAI